MARKSNMTYDPQTGKWTKSKEEKKTTTTKKTTTKTTTKKTNTTTKKSNTTTKKSSGSSSSSHTKKSSSGKVKKKYNTIKLRTLSGTLNFIANENTIKLKAGDTIELKGFGKYLSGKYYIQDITRSISSSGYTNSATVIKTDFGESVKIIKKTSNKAPKNTGTLKPVSKGKKVVTESLKTIPVTKTAEFATLTHTVTKGESPMSIARKIFGDASMFENLLDSETGASLTSNSKLFVGQVLEIT